MLSFEGRNAEQYQGHILTSQREWELCELVKIYQALNPKATLEIGTQLGGTLWHWLRAANPGAVVANLDILQNQPEDLKEYLPALWQSWAPKGVTLRTILGSSHAESVLYQVQAIFPDGLDFIFIDGDHSYEGVRQDWEMYAPLVRAGGCVAFHDLICPGPPQEHIQVGRLFREIQRLGYITRELYASPNQPWGGIGVVWL